MTGDTKRRVFIERRVFIGIDPSLTSTGLTIYDSQTVTLDIKAITTKKATNLWARQYAIVKAVVPKLTPNAVVMFEDFGMSAVYNSMGTKYLAERIELCGMLKLMAVLKKCQVYMIKPSHLKMLATGRAGAHKEEVKLAIETNFGVVTTNFDEADSFMLMLAGYAVAHAGQPDGEFWINPRTLQTCKMLPTPKHRLALKRILDHIADPMKSISI